MCRCKGASQWDCNAYNTWSADRRQPRKHNQESLCLHLWASHTLRQRPTYHTCLWAAHYLGYCAPNPRGAVTKKKLKLSNTPYVAKAPAQRHTHNTVPAP